MTYETVKKLKKLKERLQGGLMVQGRRLTDAEIEELLLIMVDEMIDSFYTNDN